MMIYSDLDTMDRMLVLFYCLSSEFHLVYDWNSGANFHYNVTESTIIRSGRYREGLENE